MGRVRRSGPGSEHPVNTDVWSEAWRENTRRVRREVARTAESQVEVLLVVAIEEIVDSRDVAATFGTVPVSAQMPQLKPGRGLFGYDSLTEGSDRAEPILIVDDTAGQLDSPMAALMAIVQPQPEGRFQRRDCPQRCIEGFVASFHV